MSLAIFFATAGILLSITLIMIIYNNIKNKSYLHFAEKASICDLHRSEHCPSETYNGNSTQGEGTVHTSIRPHIISGEWLYKISRGWKHFRGRKSYISKAIPQSRYHSTGWKSS
jgi:hypothetical protein